MSLRFRLTILHAELAPRELAVKPEPTLLQQLHCAGIDVPQACRNGTCGRCHASLLRGAATATRADQTVPLCISHAQSDLDLTLPAAPQWRQYACQLLAQHEDLIQLRLPAGRSVLYDDQFVLFCSRSASAAKLISQRQRRVDLRLHTQPWVIDKNSVVQLLCVKTSGDGRYRLHVGHQTLLTGLNGPLVREIRESLLQSELVADISA